MRSYLLHSLVEFLSSHDELKEVPVSVLPRKDISKDFFPLSLKEYNILLKCLKLYLGSVQSLVSYEFESDDVALLILKLVDAYKRGDLVD